MDGLSGIASGVDTSAIVEKLMAVKRQKRDRMNLRQSEINARGTDLKDVQSKLLALRNAAAGLRDLGTWADAQTAESSDAAHVAVERQSGSGPGGYSVDVLALARAEQHSYTYTKPAAATTLTIRSASIKLAAGATIDDAVSAINGAEDSPVYAANVDGKLILSARTTGLKASAFTASGSSLSGELVRPGQDARYKIDGGEELTSATNQVTSAIPGVRLTFKGVTDATASVTVGAPGLDKEAVKAKAKAFVDAYNDLVKTTRGHLDEKKIAGASTTAEAAQGALYGDTSLVSMLSRLRVATSDVVKGTGVASTMDELREFGISTGAATGGASTDDAKMGLLTLDEATLDKALEDPQAVRRMLGGVADGDGLAQRIEGIAKSYTGTNGTLTEQLRQGDQALKTLQDQMTAEDTRLATREARLKAQFAAMETALGNAQSQQSWLTGQITSLG